jgi:hypothetical protein
VLLLPPSSGPTQVGTTPRLAFRAVVGTKSDAVGMEVVL